MPGVEPVVGVDRRLRIIDAQDVVAAVAVHADRDVRLVRRAERTAVDALRVRHRHALVTARARLDLAEALLLLGRLEEVHSLCVDLIAFFERATMLTGALTAAAYLREAAANRTLTPTLIEHVRQYLTELERAPELRFVPPPEIN